MKKLLTAVCVVGMMAVCGSAIASTIEVVMEYKTYPSLFSAAGDETFTSKGTLSFDLSTCKMWRDGIPVEAEDHTQCDSYGLALRTPHDFITVRRKGLDKPWRYERFSRNLQKEGITVGIQK